MKANHYGRCHVAGCNEMAVFSGWMPRPPLKGLVDKEGAPGAGNVLVALCKKHGGEVHKRVGVVKAPKGPPCIGCGKALRPEYDTIQISELIEVHVAEAAMAPPWDDDVAPHPSGDGFVFRKTKNTVLGRTFTGNYGDGGKFCGTACAARFGGRCAASLVFNAVSGKWERNA